MITLKAPDNDKMPNEQFKQMYLLYRQQNMTLHDIRIIYGVEVANEFEKEMIDRYEAINKAKTYDVKVIHHTKREFINVDTSSESMLNRGNPESKPLE